MGGSLLHAFGRFQERSIMLPGSLDELRTPRLALIPITAACLHAEKLGGQIMGSLIGCELPSNWPPLHWEPHVLNILLEQYESCPEQINWHRYIALPHPDGTRTLIGTIGAFWRETSPTECEMGYSILPPYERKGLATEAAQALVELIRRDSRIRSIVAHTFPELIGSIRVMEKCGFVFEGNGEEERTIRYRLLLQPEIC
jgi:RimJ/RimL family protein N-acetyltransferase